MIYIVNKKHHTPTDRDIYIGRPSPLGNPYSTMTDTLAEYQVATVDEAVNKYEKHLRKRLLLKDERVFWQLKKIIKLARTGDAYLVCWCMNKEGKGNCHGLPIKKIVEEYLNG